MLNCTRILRWGTLALSAAAVAGFGYGATTAQATDTPAPESVTLANPRSAQPQADADVLPDFLQSGDQALPGIVNSSARSAGVTNGVRYWTAVNDANELCLIALLPGEDQFAAMSCSDSATLATAGAAVQAATSTLSVKAVFIPGDNVPDVNGFALVGTNLLVGNGDIANLPIDLGPLVDGITNFELPAFKQLP